ncbi:hypothetical protein ACS4HZ_002590 [Enterococcus faecium]
MRRKRLAPSPFSHGKPQNKTPQNKTPKHRKRKALFLSFALSFLWLDFSMKCSNINELDYFLSCFDRDFFVLLLEYNQVL